MTKKESRVQIRDAEIIFETGRFARLASGAVMLTYKDTSILATACMAKEAQESAEFFPLRVDYQEKLSSAGIIQGGYKKREGQPTAHETIIARICDRPIRPMFPEGFMNEVQLLSYVYSYDGEAQLEPLAVCAVSAALAISEIPFGKTVAAVRVGYIKGEFLVNPTVTEQKESSLNLVVAGTKDAILMIEGGSNFLSEEELLNAIEFGHKEIGRIVEAIDELRNIAGKEKASFTSFAPPKELLEEIQTHFGDALKESLFIHKKLEKEEALNRIRDKIEIHFLQRVEEGVFTPYMVKSGFKEVKSTILRQEAIDHKKRIDGRNLDDVRQISTELSLFPRTHGSALFTRGETQALCVTTLASSAGQQRIESLLGDSSESFYLQYNFPPFSVNECGRVGSPGRREIGHGKLAERALMAILPTQETFPYTMKLESNILMCNGSSSMASVCGGCLSLIDAGVPIKEPVSGVAMGLILHKGEFVILTDILGAEDDLGDMDFKVAGGRSGVVSFQMDIKVEGITIEIMRKALEKSLKGRMYILEEMEKTIPKERKKLSRHAPRLVSLKIPQGKIGAVIGPGGKQIRLIQQLGVTVDITDDGLVSISGNQPEAVEKAHQMILDIVTDIEIGKIYKGEIVSQTAFGFFVRLAGEKEGLLHISEIAHERLAKIEDSNLKEKQIIEVKVLDINDRGQIKLSRKVLLPKPEKVVH